MPYARRLRPEVDKYAYARIGGFLPKASEVQAVDCWLSNGCKTLSDSMTLHTERRRVGADEGGRAPELLFV